MDSVRLEDLLFGVPVAGVAMVSLVIALLEVRRDSTSRDPEVISIAGGFALFCGLCALVLCTGWVNFIPEPR
jgi:hypothetical protein